MGFRHIDNVSRIGSCKSCGSNVYRYARYLDDDKQRGCILAGIGGATGYWASCCNTSCENHEGKGTLPSRPIQLDEFNIDA